MTKLTEVTFSEGEKTRLLGTTSGDRFLCKFHADKRLQKGELTGIPQSAGAIMFGLRSWPSGQEPCADCQSIAELGSTP